MVDLENKVHQQSTEMEVRKKKLKELENENERLKSLLDSAQVMKEPLSTFDEQQMNQTMIIEPRTLPSQLLFENSQQTVDFNLENVLKESNTFDMKDNEFVEQKVLNWRRSIENQETSTIDAEKLLKRKPLLEVIEQIPAKSKPKRESLVFILIGRKIKYYC